MENNQITLLKTLEFSELYEKANVQRPLTIFEWAIAKEMYVDFNRLFAQLGATNMTINTLIRKLEHINGVNIRYSDDELIDIEYSMDNRSVEYVVITVSTHEDTGKLYVCSGFDVAIPRQDYEYECLDMNMAQNIIVTKDDTLKDIYDDTKPVQNVLYSVKFPLDNYSVVKNSEELYELAKTLKELRLNNGEKAEVNKLDGEVIEILRAYNIQVVVL